MNQEPPKSILVIPAGEFASRDGRAPWINDDPAAVLAATHALGMEVGLVIDYDHATDLAAPKGEPAPAAGWMRRFFCKGGEIWADVNWTETGAAAVASGTYCYISPVFEHTKTRQVRCILRAALTNNPAFQGMAIGARRAEVEIAIGSFLIPFNDGGKFVAQSESLSEAEKKIIARLSSVTESGYLRQKKLGGTGQAFAAAERRGTPGLLRGHQEIDRAHKAVYEASPDHSDALENAPDGDLLSKAISELQTYKPGDDKTYDNLLRGVLHAACLLDRNAPAFIDTKDFKP